MQEKYSGLLVPLYVGITGHRNLRPEDRERLKQIMKDEFEDLHRLHPSSPIILLTPLAEGADRLAAVAAIESGLHFVVPLPMPVGEYLKDFASQQSKLEFESLFSQASDSFVVAGSPHEATDLERETIHRENAYARVGTYIAQHSILLIALWDGISKGSGSGTSQVVNLRLNGTPLSTSMSQTPFHNLQAGPVLHIVTPRISNPNTTKPPFSREMYYPRIHGELSFAIQIHESMLSHVDDYNKEVSKTAGRSKDSYNTPQSPILEKEEALPLSDGARANLDRFHYADFLAEKFKRKRLTFLVLLLSLVLLAFLYLQMYLEFWPVPLVLLTYPLLLAVSAGIFKWAKFKRYDSKHEDYRALAEGLRIQIFWDLAQVDENAAHHYLYKHVGQLQWIRYSFLAWWVRHPRYTGDTPHVQQKNIQDRLKTTFIRWVLEQRKWYSVRSRQIEKTARILEKTSNALFVTGVFFAAFLYCIEVLHPLTSFIAYHYWIHHVIVVSVAMMLAISAAIHSFSDKTSLSETSKQYQRMVGLYTLSINKLAPLIEQSDPTPVKQVLFELGKEALTEHGDWLILNRSRPLELPKA